MDKFYPVLCGGTFLTLLLQARKQRVKSREHIKGKDDILRDHNVFFSLINIVKPFAKPESGFEKITNEYKSCKMQSTTYLSFLNDINVPDINESITAEYRESLADTVSFINKYLDVEPKGDTCERLVRRLLDLIEKDQSIDGEVKFRTRSFGLPCRKNELNGSQDKPLDVYLPVFLLSIWHFILMNRRDTTIGRNTFESWHSPQPKGSKAIREYIGTIGNNYKRPLNISLELPVVHGVKTNERLIAQGEASVGTTSSRELPSTDSSTNPPVAVLEKINQSALRAKKDSVITEDSSKKEDDNKPWFSDVNDKVISELLERLKDAMNESYIYDLIVNHAKETDEDLQDGFSNFLYLIDSKVLDESTANMLRISEHPFYDNISKLRELIENHINTKLLDLFGDKCAPPYYTRLQKKFESLIKELFNEYYEV